MDKEAENRLNMIFRKIVVNFFGKKKSQILIFEKKTPDESFFV